MSEEEHANQTAGIEYEVDIVRADGSPINPVIVDTENGHYLLVSGVQATGALVMGEKGVSTGVLLVIGVELEDGDSMTMGFAVSQEGAKAIAHVLEMAADDTQSEG